MRGTSQASYEAVAERFEPVLRTAGADAAVLGEQLFAVVDALDRSGSLRRALGDPSRPAQEKGAMALSLLRGKVDDRVAEAVSALARARWSSEQDLTEAVEGLASQSLLVAAQSQDALAEVEEELFRTERLLVDHRELRQALTDQRAAPEARSALVHQLLGGKVHPVTLQLVERAAGTQRGRTVVARLAELGQLAARRRKLLVAHVTAAVPMSREQAERLLAILGRAYGRPVQVNLALDPEVVGGVRIRVGDEVVDSTVLARLEEIRRQLAA